MRYTRIRAEPGLGEEHRRRNVSKAIADPDEIRRFAKELKRFNTDLNRSLATLRARFSALGQTWRDQEHQKFAEEFDQAMKILIHFGRATDEHIPFLLRKADRIEDYLKQR